MVDKFYFTVCLIFLLAVCLFGGWQIGYDDAMKKARKRFRNIHTELDEITRLWTVSVDGVTTYEFLDDTQLIDVLQQYIG